ncbi:multicopper oxidase family protein [Nocardiopsis sp. NPDC050513]|uniref:multicopper oxidase family protein n=1 Tax=Nocardiopsis sp. NPDC050513 TaxID=3364338 RepID=UPI0037A3A315
MSMSRRDSLRLATFSAVAVPLAGAAVSCGNGSGGNGSGNENEGSTGRLLESAADLPEPGTVPLPVPPVLEPQRSDAEADYYVITQRSGEAEILPGLTTEVWGYDGIFPGPTIVSRTGRRTVVEHRNDLPVPVAVHLHGGHTPPEHDGYPTDLIFPRSGWESRYELPGDTTEGSRVYEYPMNQPAATLWYHDHRMDFTGPQVYKGLAGFHLVHDDEEEALPLPTGDRDVPLMICDRAFDEDGSFLYPALSSDLVSEPGVANQYMSGVLGDAILVNGAPWPYMEVADVRYRFRILNASNARRYRLVLDPAPEGTAPFVQVASDAGLLGAPIEHDAIVTAPAERFDVIVDFSGYSVGTEVVLANEFGEGRTAEVMRFRVTSEARDDTRIPDRLSDFVPMTRESADAEHRARFSREAPNTHGPGPNLWTINGQTFSPDTVDARIPLDSTQIWRLTTNVHHPVHLHLVRFQVLSRNGGEPGPYDAGWKDTIDLGSEEEAEIIMTFSGYRGRFVYHCHNLEHEDMMMMANFEVT